MNLKYLILLSLLCCTTEREKQPRRVVSPYGLRSARDSAFQAGYQRGYALGWSIGYSGHVCIR